MKKLKTSKGTNGNIVLETVQTSEMSTADADNHVFRLKELIPQWQRQQADLQTMIDDANEQISQIEAVKAL